MLCWARYVIGKQRLTIYEYRKCKRIKLFSRQISIGKQDGGFDG